MIISHNNKLTLRILLSVSCTVKILCCFPVLGPMISMVSALSAMLDGDDAIARSELDSRTNGAQLAVGSGQVNSEEILLTEYITKYKTHLMKANPHIEKAREYSIYGIIGNVLSIVIAVSLFALQILPLAAAAIVSFPFFIFSAVCIHGVYRNKVLVH